ncbi:unnamed protein product [Ranitomeya imitator]|uniref:Uncharacterized protein n=1 Tax=Ranitomeya imitator TaxID=111125 RepID=A0ABN9L4P2_9NEOB|nr:unnamed protein product [Ranitomeya imitator]
MEASVQVAGPENMTMAAIQDGVERRKFACGKLMKILELLQLKASGPRLWSWMTDPVASEN